MIIFSDILNLLSEESNHCSKPHSQCKLAGPIDAIKDSAPAKDSASANDYLSPVMKFGDCVSWHVQVFIYLSKYRQRKLLFRFGS